MAAMQLSSVVLADVPMFFGDTALSRLFTFLPFVHAVRKVHFSTQSVVLLCLMVAVVLRLARLTVEHCCSTVQ